MTPKGATGTMAVPSPSPQHPTAPLVPPRLPQGRWPQPGTAPRTPCLPPYKTNTTGPYRQILYGFHGLRKGWERSYKKKVGPSHSLKPPPGCPLRWLDSYPVVLGSTGINWAHWDGKLGRGKRLAAGPVTSRHQPPVSRRAPQPLGCCRQPGMKNLLRKLVPNTPCPGAGQRRSDFKLEHQIIQWTQSKKKKNKTARESYQPLRSACTAVPPGPIPSLCTRASCFPAACPLHTGPGRGHELPVMPGASAGITHQGPLHGRLR